jgi:hypothetical protein
MQWEKLNWEILDRLRAGFIGGTAAGGPYWQSLEDLEQYDQTFGERIGWKWDAVLRELRLRGWAPKSQDASGSFTLLDWGCGSGIAGRRVVDFVGAGRVARLLLHDHSDAARQFAAARAKQLYPQIEATPYDGRAEFDILVVSHVLNELSSESQAALLRDMARAKSVIWVEPGTHAVSRQLAAIRETLRKDVRVIAPCTHADVCGLLSPENARHWCHYFADPPPAIYADSDWVRFGQRAGIDLRSLPYSFLVLDSLSVHDPGDLPASRIIGGAEHFKGYAKVLSCAPGAVEELILQKRDAPELFKALKSPEGVPVYRWRREGNKIKDAVEVYPPAPDADPT